MTDMTLAQARKQIAVTDDTPIGFQTNNAFSAIVRVGKMFAKSNLVPKDYSGDGETAIANATIAVEVALRLRMSPLLVMNNMYLVHGRPSWASAFLIACFNTCGRFSAIKYHMVDEAGNPVTPGKPAFGCYCSAVEKDSGTEITGTLVTIAMAKAEKWWSKKDRNGNETSKWQTMPEQMLRYRAAAFFIRTVAPELSMGLYTEDEVQDFAEPPTVATATTEPEHDKVVEAEIESVSKET